jgi:sulfite exporter TauE/SafE
LRACWQASFTCWQARTTLLPWPPAFAIGTLHGLAGSSHIFGVLPALALPSTFAAAVYLLAFGIGSVAAMTCVAWVLGLVALRYEKAGNRVYQGMMGTCGAGAIVVGCILLVK